MGGRVPRRRDGAELGVPELDALAVAERHVIEVDTGAGGEIGGRARALDELRQSRDVVGLHMRLEGGDDGGALCIGQGDVVVDEVDVRIDDREPLLRLAAEEVGGAGRALVQELSKEHAPKVGDQLLCAKSR